MKKIKTASNIRFKRYTYRRYEAQQRLAQITPTGIDELREALRRAPEVRLAQAA